MFLIFGANGGIGKGLLTCPWPDQVRGVYRTDCDVEDPAAVDEFLQVTATTEPLYIVNATGALTNGVLRHQSPEDVRRMCRVGLEGSAWILRAFAKYAPPGSSVLLLSSIVATVGVAGAAMYGAVKAGLEGLTRGAAKEFARRSLRVNCLRMGYFEGGMTTRIPAGVLTDIVNDIPAGRLGTVPELAPLCQAILLSTYMTGEIVTIAGGLP